MNHKNMGLRMKRFFSIIVTILIAIISAKAQVVELEPDSAVIKLRKELLETENPINTEKPKQAESAIYPTEMPEKDYSSLELPEFKWKGIPKYKEPTLPHWSTGMITGHSGGSANMQLGGINYAGAAIMQSLGRYWIVSGGIDLAKYGVMYNTASFNAAAIYRPSKNFGVTVFGTYSPGSFMSDINIGQSYQFGGFITLESDSNWGIDLGASHSYDSMSGYHNTTPIVHPYYNLNGAKLGIDFGPMIENMLRKNGRSNSLDFNPSGPRPIKAIPPVAPRR